MGKNLGNILGGRGLAVDRGCEERLGGRGWYGANNWQSSLRDEVVILVRYRGLKRTATSGAPLRGGEMV